MPKMCVNKIVILHNIRSAHNVGSVFRTADGAGVAKIFLTGYTPAPLDRFGREHAEIAKTSLGATHTVPYEYVENIHEVLTRLKEEVITVVAVEITPRATNYEQYVPNGTVAFLFGNEITGIETELLEEIDQHIFIPMRGAKESLNVSVCAAVVLFRY